jgi:hypothetical protein
MQRAVAAALVLTVLLAGCASKGTTGALPDVPAPGTIAGVVVDEAVRPIKGAAVELLDGNHTSTATDEAGAFILKGVAPGVHLLKASHPLYDTQQQSIEVQPGAAEGSRVKMQLNRVIFAQPYVQTQKFDGFLVCSVGFFEYASEECGEGVGVPCEVPQPVGCHRWGGQGNNHAQYDFWLDGSFARSLVLEAKWVPSSPTLSEFYFISATEWTCDPFCIGNELNLTTGGSPLHQHLHIKDGMTATRTGGTTNVTATTRFSTFVWPNWGCADFSVSTDPNCLQQVNVAINQPFQVFATASYYLPLPDDWSFIKGDAPPF